jgi:polysaccharide biosynthesis/export protein
LIRRFTMLLACAWAGGVELGTPSAVAAVAPEAIHNTNAPLSLVTSAKRAPWQERLTLGPGDAFDLSLFRHPELSRTNLVVGPDGRISFLQVQDLPVAGLTIDEVRAKLESVLAPFFVGGVRAIVVPVSFTSKKYYMLGKVVTEGAFVLDRPLTIIEAVARAKGLQTGTFDRNSGGGPDLSRSFLARHGERMPVDFERLFFEGDLSQNIPLEPNDYLYFAPASLQEIYVLGEVLNPGRVAAISNSTVLTVLADRGGFTSRAYRKRVLVIRGSLQRPEAFAIDTPAILAGRTPDFKLQPKDLVYVNERPWIRVEELLDIAAQAFIESAVTFWVGENVPSAFSTPVIPSL